jgi:hypothetical protein
MPYDAAVHDKAVTAPPVGTLHDDVADQRQS